MKQITVLLLLAFFTFNSCKKNEDNGIQITTENVQTTLKAGTWRITHYDSSGVDKLGIYSEYTFTFMDAGSVRATRGTNFYMGDWSVTIPVPEVGLLLSFMTSPVSPLSNGYKVLNLYADKLNLSYTGFQSGSMILEKN